MTTNDRQNAPIQDVPRDFLGLVDPPREGNGRMPPGGRPTDVRKSDGRQRLQWRPTFERTAHGWVAGRTNRKWLNPDRLDLDLVNASVKCLRRRVGCAVCFGCLYWQKWSFSKIPSDTKITYFKNFYKSNWHILKFFKNGVYIKRPLPVICIWLKHGFALNITSFTLTGIGKILQKTMIKWVIDKGKKQQVSHYKFRLRDCKVWSTVQFSAYDQLDS